MCDMTPAERMYCVPAYVTWLIHVCDVWHDACRTYVLRACTCNMTPSYASCHSFMCVCHSFMCVCHSFMCVIWYWRLEVVCIVCVHLCTWRVTHTHTLSLSLSHTHTRIPMAGRRYVCIACVHLCTWCITHTHTHTQSLSLSLSHTRIPMSGRGHVCIACVHMRKWCVW